MANTIANLFGRPPFRPLQDHMKVVEECAMELGPLFEAVIAGEYDRVETIANKIFELEDQADRVKNEIRAHLPKSLFMAVDRRDLLDLLHSQDSIADSAQDVAGLFLVRKMVVPDYLAKELTAFVRRNLDAVQLASKIIQQLDELVETGFRGRQADAVEQMVQELGRTESETDRLGMDLTRTLYEHEDDFKPLTILLWHQLLEWIGDVADYAEDVGDRLRLLIAR